MKQLAVISIACLAFLAQVTLAQNNDTVVDDVSSNTTSTSGNVTAEGNATEVAVDSVPENITALVNASADNQTEPEVTNSTVNVSGNSSEPSSSFTNSSQSNDTESNEPIESTPSNVPAQSRNVSTSDMSMFGVSDDCADAIKTCYMQDSSASADFEQFLYCDAFEKSSQCVSGNNTSDNATMSCSMPELKLLKVFSCTPTTMGLGVAPQCKARLTECTTPYVTSAEKMAGVSDELFESKICATLETKGCLDVANDGAVCSSGEIADIESEVVCSGTDRLLSGVLLLAAMLLLTRVM